MFSREGKTFDFFKFLWFLEYSIWFYCLSTFVDILPATCQAGTQTTRKIHGGWPSFNHLLCRDSPPRETTMTMTMFGFSWFFVFQCQKQMPKTAEHWPKLWVSNTPISSPEIHSAPNITVDQIRWPAHLSGSSECRLFGQLRLQLNRNA